MQSADFGAGAGRVAAGVPDPDFPTITWTEDNIGKAIFYYEGDLNERFMKVHT